MGNPVLRGSRLGSTSYETTHGRELAPRQITAYVCPEGHEFVVPFSDEAESIPAEWECRQCGKTALLVNGPAPDAKVTKHVRTHWDMLLERRTRAELEDVLAERLAHLRNSQKKSA